MNNSATKKLCLLIVVHLVCTTAFTRTTAIAQETIVRSSTDPKATASLGQRVVLRIDVLGKDSWAQLPKLPTVQVPGAIVFVPPNQNLRLSETVKKANYTGQRYEWWIYPQNAGELQIPEVAVQVVRKNFGSAETPDPVESQSDPHTVQITRPDGVVVNGPLITTPSLEADQSWSDRIDALSAGDGVTRTIVRVIRDAPSLVLPPIEFQTPAGAQSYIKQADTSDKIQRGDLTGRRTDAVTYTFPRAGEYQLPAIDVHWFDTKSKTLRTVTLDGQSVTVAPAATTAGDTVPGDASANQRGVNSAAILAWAAALILAAITGFLFRHQIAGWWSRLSAHRAQTEAAFFHRFLASMRSGDPAATLRDLTRWSDRVQCDVSAPKLIDLFNRYGTETDTATLVELQSAVNDHSPKINMTALQIAAKAIRKKHRHHTNSVTAEARSALPPLHAKI